MNTTNVAVGVGVLVTIGRWSQGDSLSVRVVVGVVFLAVALAVLPPKIAQPMAALILVAVLFKYAQPIIDASGIAKGTKS